MYRAPTAEEERDRDYRFGDAFEAPWIFDLVLRSDSVPVSLQQVPGRPDQQAFYPQDISTIRGRRHYPKDRVIAHADAEGLAIGNGNGALAVIVSDTCDIAEAVRAKRGRLTFAALAKLPPEGEERDKALATLAFDRYPVSPQSEIDFNGGVIEFQQSFSIMAKDLVEAATRVLTIDDDQVRQLVHYRWSAHATRHGPVAAADGALKLAKLVTANGDRERATALRLDRAAPIDPLDRAIIEPLKDLLLIPWLLEGPVVDRIGTALEEGRAYRPLLNDVLALLRSIGPRAERAIEAIERAAAAHEGDSTR
jgi:hypothetical protein